jgi:hypothetical protein
LAPGHLENDGLSLQPLSLEFLRLFGQAFREDLKIEMLSRFSLHIIFVPNPLVLILPCVGRC